MREYFTDYSLVKSLHESQFDFSELLDCGIQNIKGRRVSLFQGVVSVDGNVVTFAQLEELQESELD